MTSNITDRLEQLRRELETRNYSPRTVESYMRFAFSVNKIYITIKVL